MEIETTDMLGRNVVVAPNPTKIVSLVPSVTELLYDLGLEERVVGITKFCVKPEAWFRSKTRIGGTKDVKIEQVLALKPDLVFANQEENVKAQVEQLAGSVPVWVSNVTDIPSALEMIEATAALTNRIGAGQRLLAEIADGLKQIATPPHPTATLYAIWRNPWMFAGGGTYIDSLLHTFGFHNLLAHRPRYPTLSLEDIRELEPETILLSSEPYPFQQKHVDELAALCPKARIILADGEMFGWYGSRLKFAVPYIEHLRKSIGN
jgi:ABC-type Fe3+-hydroxamate transport system substrate-binding protein